MQFLKILCIRIDSPSNETIREYDALIAVRSESRRFFLFFSHENSSETNCFSFFCYISNIQLFSYLNQASSWKWFRSNIERIESEAMGIHYVDCILSFRISNQKTKKNSFYFFRILNSDCEMRGTKEKKKYIYWNEVRHTIQHRKLKFNQNSNNPMAMMIATIFQYTVSSTFLSFHLTWHLVWANEYEHSNTPTLIINWIFKFETARK